MPLHKFILTNSGEAVNSNMAMMSESIKSIGISLLGGNANIQGKFELGIDYIGATTDVSGSSPGSPTSRISLNLFPLRLTIFQAQLLLQQKKMLLQHLKCSAVE